MYQFILFHWKLFNLLTKFEGKGLRSELKNRAGSPALKAGFKNLFGPPSIESNAILPESLSLRLAFKFDTFEAVKSSDFEVFSFFRSRIWSSGVESQSLSCEIKERKVLIFLCQDFILKISKIFKIRNI